MTARVAKSSKPGARPRGPFEGKRKTLTTRITEKTRESLEKAAQEADRSLSQEIELRLEQSFLEDGFLGGPENATAAKLVGPILQDPEVRTGKSWREDKNTYYGAVVAVLAIMRLLGPRDVLHPKMAFDKDPGRLDEHIISDSIDAVAKIAVVRKSQGK